MSLLWLACYTNGPFEAGPEVFDDPIDHDDDTWLFSLERINRIDLEVDAVRGAATQVQESPSDAVGGRGLGGLGGMLGGS